MICESSIISVKKMPKSELHCHPSLKKIEIECIERSSLSRKNEPYLDKCSRRGYLQNLVVSHFQDVVHLFNLVQTLISCISF
jgi:hypothetical protein